MAKYKINIKNSTVTPTYDETRNIKIGYFNTVITEAGLDFTGALEASIKNTSIDGKDYKTCYYVSTGNVSDEYRGLLINGTPDNLNGVIPEYATASLITLCDSKGNLTNNHFSATSGGNNSNIKPYMGKYYIGTTAIDGYEIGKSAYLSKTNTNLTYLCETDLPTGKFIGWVLLQKETNNNWSVFASFVSANYWENTEVAPFGNTTPTGSIGGYGTYDDTSDSIPVPDNYIDDIYANAFGGNGMHLYGVSGEGLKNFLSKVYTTDFWQYWANTLFNPMDGIISCLYLPINYGLVNGANTNSVHVSNAELATGEGKVKILYNYTYDTSTSVLPIEEYFGSFLDYAPYTSAELYLPFYGTVPINIDSIMGGSIKVQYRINLVTGTFSVFVICVDRFGVQTILQYAGSCGMSIPIVSGNNGAQNRITDLVQGIANVALGNYVGAGMNAVNALTEKGYVYTNSKISGSAGYDGVKDVFLTITRPVVSNPEKYSEIKQRPADMFVKLSELSGEYSIEKQNLDIHDKNITDEEITEIENLLQGGVIF